jgi:predicted nucleic acid-binding Zn finger protein
MVAKKTGRASRVDSTANYTFRRVFSAEPGVREGCLGVWEVLGGKENYQIAIEAVAGGWQQWHCTCPDAVYRSGPIGRACKHVVALRKANPRD